MIFSLICSLSNTFSVNTKKTQFEIGDWVQMSKHVVLFARSYILNLTEEIFRVKDVKNLYPLYICYWRFEIECSKRYFLWRDGKKTKKMLFFRVEKVLKREVDKVLVKLGVHGSSFHNDTGLLKILEVVLFNTIPINVSVFLVSFILAIY